MIKLVSKLRKVAKRTLLRYLRSASNILWYIIEISCWKTKRIAFEFRDATYMYIYVHALQSEIQTTEWYVWTYILANSSELSLTMYGIIHSHFDRYVTPLSTVSQLFENSKQSTVEMKFGVFEHFRESNALRSKGIVICYLYGPLESISIFLL